MTSKRALVHACMERLPLTLTCGLGLVVWLGLPSSGKAAEEPVRLCAPTGDFIEYGDLIDCVINPPRDLDVFEFSGREGERVRIDIAELSGPGDACIELWNPDGRRLDSSCYDNRIDATLPEDGTYTIVVSENGNSTTVQYRLSVQCIRGGPDGCPVPPIPDVTGCVHFMGAPLVNRSVDLLQTGEPTQRTRTDTRGCYRFNQAVSGKPFRVILRGPAVP